MPRAKKAADIEWFPARSAAKFSGLSLSMVNYLCRTKIVQFRDIRAMAAKASKEGGQDFQALLGHTTRAMSERYIKGRQTVVAEPVRRKL